MWFAALGSYQGAPWLVNLADKLLEGSPAVMRLLDTKRYPFVRETADGSELVPPAMVKARLFHYDFTR
jgi:hypothetical protein